MMRTIALSCSEFMLMSPMPWAASARMGSGTAPRRRSDGGACSGFSPMKAKPALGGGQFAAVAHGGKSEDRGMRGDLPREDLVIVLEAGHHGGVKPRNILQHQLGRETVGLGEQHVEGHGRRAHVLEAGKKLRQPCHAARAIARVRAASASSMSTMRTGTG